MIRYKRGSVYIILNLFKFKGSTFPYTICIALPCAILSAVLQKTYPEGSLRVAVFGAQDVGGIMSESQAWSGFSFLVGFLIVFRTSQAYGRFWEGCTASHQMRAEWFDACSSLISFCKASCAPPDTIHNFKSLLVRLTSMLHAAALGALEDGDLNPLLDDEPRHEDRKFAGRTVQRSADQYPLFKGNGDESMDEESIQTIKNCECRVELIFEWIQQLVVENIETGVLSIPPPILSRSFQELANGMVAFHDAMKISHIPFPFPYAQSCDLLLVFHWVLVPFVTSQWVSNPFWAAIFTFVQVFILWSLNLIAIQIDNPFGHDSNDINAGEMQDEINRHLQMLLEPTTERTPRLTRKSRGYLQGVERCPSRNSFVDLFKDEDDEEEGERSMHGGPSSPRNGPLQHLFSWASGVQTPVSMSMQNSLSMLGRRKSEVRDGKDVSANVRTGHAAPPSPKEIPHEGRGRRWGEYPDRPPPPRWEQSQSTQATSYALESLARNLQNAVRPQDEESFGGHSGGHSHDENGSIDETVPPFDASSNFSVVMIDADAHNSGREGRVGKPSASEALSPRRLDSSPRAAEASSRGSSKKTSKVKVMVHACPKCGRDLICNRGNGGTECAPCGQCGKVVQSLKEHSCTHCRQGFCRECVRNGVTLAMRPPDPHSQEVYV